MYFCVNGDVLAQARHNTVGRTVRSARPVYLLVSGLDNHARPRASLATLQSGRANACSGRAGLACTVEHVYCPTRVVRPHAQPWCSVGKNAHTTVHTLLGQALPPRLSVALAPEELLGPYALAPLTKERRSGGRIDSGAQNNMQERGNEIMGEEEYFFCHFFICWLQLAILQLVKLQYTLAKYLYIATVSICTYIQNIKHKDICLCWLVRHKCQYRANNHGSNSHLYIILEFLQLKCEGHDNGGNSETRKTDTLIQQRY